MSGPHLQLSGSESEPACGCSLGKRPGTGGLAEIQKPPSSPSPVFCQMQEGFGDYSGRESAHPPGFLLWAEVGGTATSWLHGLCRAIFALTLVFPLQNKPVDLVPTPCNTEWRPVICDFWFLDWKLCENETPTAGG